VIPAETPANELVMSHISVNFDRTGFQQDLNVVFPIDRLRELVADGEVGSMASVHYSFVGAFPPAAAEPHAQHLAGLLKAHKGEAALLGPGWPRPRAVGAPGLSLEPQGPPTAAISLVREHPEVPRPPRALWVTFELGRPLG